MDAETLDRLLMDRALGALADDVNTLLEAYVAQDAALAARAAEFDAAVRTARAVLGTEPDVVLPPFAATETRRAARGYRRRVVLRGAAGIAAALLLGVGLGSWRRAAEPATSTTPGTPSASLVAASNAAPGAAVGTGEFWSARRLYGSAGRARHDQSKRVIWDSPSSIPKLGDAL